MPDHMFVVYGCLLSIFRLTASSFSPTAPMRHRVTFVHSQQSDNVVKSITPTTVEIDPSVSVAREDKLTFTTQEYSHIQSLRVQVVKPFEATDMTRPFGYLYQPGLHVYVIPRAVQKVNERDAFFTQVTQAMQEIFGIDMDSNRMILSLNSFYYHTSEIPDMPKAMAKWSNKAGSSWDALDYLLSDGTAVLKTLEAALDRLVVNEDKDYTEVGVFGLEKHSTTDDIILTGIRAILNDEGGGTDTKDFVHKTMFHIKPRHRTTDQLVDPKFKSNGLHPVFVFDHAPQKPHDEDVTNCKLYCYLTLDNAVFVDRYQIPEPMSILASYGPDNLELPSYSIKGWGNEVLMELANAEYPFDFTLHSRYQLPSPNDLQTHIKIDKPYLFYGCEAGSDAFLLNNSPFDNKRKIGGTFEKFFTDDTIFYQAGERGVAEVSIPHAAGTPMYANVVTSVAIFLGLWMVVSKLWGRTRYDRKND